MRCLILLLLLLAPATRAQDLSEIRLGERRYLIAVPQGLAPPPLIVALHGGGGGPEQFARSSGLVAPALRAGFAVAFPAGSGRRDGRALLTWNAGYCCAWAQVRRVDDVGFLDAVAADARRRFGVSRVYATGMSNGAMMAQLWAAERPGSVAAVASVAGTMDAARVRVRGPVPLLHIHGLDDQHVRFDGGSGKRALSRVDFAPVAAVMEDFAAPFGPLTLTETRSGAVTRGLWRDAARRVRLELIAITGGGHAWPGDSRNGAGSPVDANAEVLRFFAAN